MYHISTTPFGRRPVTAGLLAAQMQATATPALPAADKYTVLDDLRTARAQFGLSDRDLAVLHALISFHQPREIAGDTATVVYPSNRRLAERAHGMAESTLRRHLAVLVHAGLVLRCDSPNGKRYAARGVGGEIVRAFGLDLRPLAVRAREIAQIAQETRATALVLRRTREDVVLLLRDAGKLVSYGSATCPAQDWTALEHDITGLRKSLRRKLDLATLTQMAEQAREILDLIHPMLDPDAAPQETPELSGSDSQNERHQQNTNKEISISKTNDQNTARAKTTGTQKKEDTEGQGANVPLALVLKACPDVLPYAQGHIRHWHQLRATVANVRRMMGINSAAWDDAQRVMGPDVAAVTCAAMLQRIAFIHNPGGYLRALTARSEARGFSPGSMIMALLNAQTDVIGQS